MAVWQFDLYFIRNDESPPDTTAEDWDMPPLPRELVSGIQETLAHYFGPPWFMLEDWLVFGPENGNRIDVGFDDEAGASVFVRCDKRIEAPQFLVLVADLAKSHECRFFCPETKELIDPDLHRLSNAMAQSQALRISGNPRLH